jgi:hypothetical protein
LYPAGPVKPYTSQLEDNTIVGAPACRGGAVEAAVGPKVTPALGPAPSCPVKLCSTVKVCAVADTSHNEVSVNNTASEKVILI